MIVLKRFGMKPMPGVRITLVCRDEIFREAPVLVGTLLFIDGHSMFLGRCWFGWNASREKSDDMGLGDL